MATNEAKLTAAIEPGNLYRCRRCFLGLRLPSPDPRILEEIYSEIPDGRWSNDLSLPQTTAVRMITEGYLAGRVSRILDVGAFTGNFLGALPVGITKVAIEPSCGGRERLTQQGIQILKPFLAEPTSSEKSCFDVVTLFDVFEHLPDPISGMQMLMSYVRPGGQLIVATGNLDHWTFRRLRGKHWYFDPVQHVSVASVSHLKWLAAQLKAPRLTLKVMSHQHRILPDVVREYGETLYFATRSATGIGNSLQRIFHVLPFFRRISHRQTTGYLMNLADHVVAVFDKSTLEVEP